MEDDYNHKMDEVPQSIAFIHTTATPSSWPKKTRQLAPPSFEAKEMATESAQPTVPVGSHRGETKSVVATNGFTNEGGPVVSCDAMPIPAGVQSATGL